MMVICLGGLNCQRNFRLPDQPRRLELPANLNRELPANFNKENPLATPGFANAPAKAQAQQCAFGSVCFGNWRLIMCNGRWRWVITLTLYNSNDHIFPPGDQEHLPCCLP